MFMTLDFGGWIGVYHKIWRVRSVCRSDFSFGYERTRVFARIMYMDKGHVYSGRCMPDTTGHRLSGIDQHRII